MEQVKLSLPIRCPDHNSQLIGMIDTDPEAKKVVYCYECLEKNNEEGIIIKTLKSLPSYLKEKSSFYESCRQRAQLIGETPANYIEELSKKGECLERFSKDIDQEKENVKNQFEQVRKAVIQIINQKESECLQLLDKQIVDLSEAYMRFEKLLSTGWPKPSEIQAMYPELDVLKQKMSRIANIDQLQAFMTGIQDDIRREKASEMEKDSLRKKIDEIDRLIRCFNLPESSFPRAKSNFLIQENFEGLMKEFIQQQPQVENSILARINGLAYGSEIINNDQLKILKDWLPKNYKFNLNLLYRGSADGMSSKTFHQKCDGKGSTITLVKCRFDGALESRNLGGFIDKSWHSKGCYSSSGQAFVFLLNEQGNSVKCPISDTGKAFYGDEDYGPKFGQDLEIENTLQTGSVRPNHYWNTNSLCDGKAKTFRIEDIEVFQVQ